VKGLTALPRDNQAGFGDPALQSENALSALAPLAAWVRGFPFSFFGCDSTDRFYGGETPGFPTMKKIIPFALSLMLLAGCQTAPQTATPVTAAAVPVFDPFVPADGAYPGKGAISSWSGFKAKNIERRTLFAQQKAADQDAIVFVGDSITEGWQTLQQDFAGLGVKVVNRGIGGDTTPNLLYRLQDDILSLHPKGMVITIGTNDLGQHTSPADIADNLKILHARVRAAYPDIRIAWCLVMPRKGDDTYPERIHALNAMITQIVQSDPKITLCDSFTPLALPDGSSKAEDFVEDHLHLNPAGYAVWREALFPILAGWKLGTE
jgi:lysophospholipase L1-like esterase